MSLIQGQTVGGKLKFEITASGEYSRKYTATLDTGFTGFVLVNQTAIDEMGLKPQGTEEIKTLARVISSRVALGFVSIDGEVFMEGSVSIVDNFEEVLLGMGYLQQSKTAMVLFSRAVFLVPEKELIDYLREMERRELNTDAPSDSPLGSDERH